MAAEAGAADQYSTVVENVIGNVVCNGGLKLPELCLQYEVPTPRGLSYPSQWEGQDTLVIYTDLEPDDIFAILSIITSKIKQLTAPPIVIFTADPKNQDTGTIFQKKMVMSALALGLDFMSQMLITTGSPTGGDYGSLKPPYTGVETEWTHVMQEATTRIGDAATKGTGPVHFYFLAPGRGNIAGMHAQMASQNWYSELAGRCKVSIYSGSFNVSVFLTIDPLRNSPARSLRHFSYLTRLKAW